MAKFARAIALAVAFAALASVPLSSASKCQTLCAKKVKSGEATSCIVIDDAKSGFCSFMDSDVTFSGAGTIVPVSDDCIKCSGIGTIRSGGTELGGKTDEDYAAYKGGCGGNGIDILDLTLPSLSCYDDGMGNGVVSSTTNVFAITSGLGNKIGQVLKEGDKANYVMIIDLTDK